MIKTYRSSIVEVDRFGRVVSVPAIMVDTDTLPVISASRISRNEDGTVNVSVDAEESTLDYLSSIYEEV